MGLIKTPEEIKTMAEAGRILAKTMKELEKMVKPGVAAKDLDKAAQGLVLESGAECSFLGHQGFPACLCFSLNQEIVHGAPADKVLKEGDIVSLDLGVFYKGFHADMAVTLPVGRIDPEKARLIRATKKALKRGIKRSRAGNTFGDVGNTIQRHLESQGFGVVRELCGHGIGRELHEDPKIPNYGKRGKGEAIKKGMVFCLEPMATIGDWKIKKSKDGYGLESADSSLSCHFEHTIAVTDKGPEILTKI